MKRYIYSIITTILFFVLITNILAQDSLLQADFIQSGGRGLIVMAAEDYSSYRPGFGVKEGETFTLEDSTAGFMGDGYMRANMAAGDGSTENAENVNIKLSYNIKFNETGTHYIWAHVFFPDPHMDSFFFGVDGKVIEQIAGAPYEQWNWHKGNTSFEIDSTGVHSLDIFGREPNSLIDHIIVTIDPIFDPTVDDFLHGDLTQIFVAPEGNDDNSGTIDEPLATLQKAQRFASPGDTVYIRGGEYHPTEEHISQENGSVSSLTYLNKSGTAGNRINYWAYPGETPIFDFSDVKPAGRRIVGIYVKGSYLHIKGLEMTGIQTTILTHTESYCVFSQGNNNIIEQISMHDNIGTGLRHYDGGGNLFLNCDSYRNWDNVSEAGIGDNNDGFGCHPDTGAEVNTFKGCRAWFNSDDGFDVIRSGAPVVFDSCWAFYNGYSTTFQSLGDGIGFKAGGYAYDAEDQIPEIIPRNIIRFCIAVRNKTNGFDANYHLGGNNWFNNTGYLNTRNDFDMTNRPSREDATNISGPGYDHVLKNNLAWAQSGDGTSNIGPDNTQENNSWNLGIAISSGDFLSADMNQLSAPRSEDGSLPVITFLHPAAGSDVIDAGVDIGFPFLGNAPDIGAFEFDPVLLIEEKDQLLPERLNLFPNYPNPFNPTTTIKYYINNKSKVELTIYDITGRKIKTLINQIQNAGEHSLSFDASGLASGVYIYKLNTGTFEQSRKMLLLR